MFGVVQFFENGRLQVLAVPMSWLKGNLLLWPKSIGNDKIEQMRKSGTAFHGSTKAIPALITKKFRNFEPAEAAVEELARKEVSDFEGKRKTLIAAKKKKKPDPKTNDLNDLCEAIVKEKQQCAQSTSSQVPVRAQNSASSAGRAPLMNLRANTLLQLPTPQRQIDNSPDQSNSVEGLTFQIEEEVIQVADIIPVPKMCDITTMSAPGTSFRHEAHTGVKLTSLPQEEQSGVEQTDGTSEAVTDIDALIRQAVYDSVNAAVPAAIEFHLTKTVEKAVDLAVAKAVDKCFASNFARLAATIDVMRKDKPQNDTSSNEETAIEKRSLIDTEEQAEQFNIDLGNKALHSKYLEYYSRIIVPNSYAGKGDNAMYIVADCLFTRQFWNKFTWTGVSKGTKSNRGFREFGNVTELMLCLVQIGDPAYTKQHLEKFCKTRLFRHSKTRATNKLVRKSACRVRRGVPKIKLESDVLSKETDQPDQPMEAASDGEEFNGFPEDDSDEDEDYDGLPAATSEEEEDSRQLMESDDSSE